MAVPLVHNARNAVTAAIERIEYDGGWAVRKVLNGENAEDVAAEWRASSEPHHWNYWRREACVYDAGEPFDALDGTGVRLPRVKRRSELAPKRTELLLEYVEGRTGGSLSLDDYRTVCRGWGVAQARMKQASWRTAWSSQSFLRTYGASKPVHYGLLRSDEAWARPLIADNWPPSLRRGLQFLYDRREALLELCERAPRLPSHLDFWPNNVFVDAAGNVVPIDWAFFGEGGLGEDIANFIPDAVFDGFVASSDLPRLEAELVPAYHRGLTEGGADVEFRAVERNVRACAVKYVWLGPLLLERAAQEEQRAYGGEPLADANHQYRERGAALAFLVDWAKSALDG